MALPSPLGEEALSELRFAPQSTRAICWECTRSSIERSAPMQCYDAQFLAATVVSFSRRTDLRLSLFTDFSLRLLMYLAVAEKNTWVKTPEVARAFGISVFHLQKAVQGLVRAGHIVAQPGRTGGLQLARDPNSMRLGGIVSELEGSGCLVDCGRGPCPLAGNCILKGALDEAELGFIRSLDRYTLADVVVGRTKKGLEHLVTLHSRRIDVAE